MMPALLCCILLAGLLARAARRSRNRHARWLRVVRRLRQRCGAEHDMFLATAEELKDEWARAEALNEELRFYREEDNVRHEAVRVIRSMRSN
jgi:hypothetical protein